MTTDSDGTTGIGHAVHGSAAARPSLDSLRRSGPDLVSLAVLFAVIDLVQSCANGFVEAFMIGPYHFYFNDLAVFLLGCAILARTARISRIPAIGYCAIALGAVQLFDLLRGAAVNPVQAFEAFRATIDLPLFCAIFLILRPKTQRVARYLPAILLGTVALVALFLARSVYGEFFLIRDLTILAGNDVLEGRLLSANGAVFVGCSALLFMHIALTTKQRGRAQFYGWAASLSLIIELVTRQRTATAATIVAFVVYFACSPRAAIRIPAALKAFVLGSCVLFAALFVSGTASKLESLVPERFQSSFEKTNTLEAREGFWVAAWEEFQNRDPFDQWFGYYAGRPTMLVTDTGLWQTSLHNQYVQVLNNFGYVGLGAFFLLVVGGSVSALKAARRRDTQNSAGVSPNVALAWLAAMIVFGIGYEWTEVISIFFVLAAAPWGEEPGTSRTRLPSVWRADASSVAARR